MKITVEIKNLKEAIDKYGENKIKKIFNISLKKSIQSGKTEASQLIRKKFKIEKSVLDRKIKFFIQRTGELKGEIVVRGEPISLMYFKPYAISGGIKTFAAKGRGQKIPGLAMRRVKSKPTEGIVVEIIRGKKTVLRRPFFIIGKGNVPLVVIRRSSGKIHKVSVITEASMFKQQIDKVAEKVIEQFKKNWDNQFKQLASGYAKWLE